MICYLFTCNNPECRTVHVDSYAIDDRMTGIKRGRREVTYTFRRDADLTRAPFTARSFRASVNLDTGKIEPHPELPHPSQDAALLECFREKLDGALLENLRRRWRRALKKTDRTSWRQKDRSWFSPGAMVPWAKIFPDDADFLISRGGRLYWAMDSYCVTPSCTCKEVLVSFFETGDQGSRNELGSVYADYDEWRLTRIIPSSCGEKMLQGLWKILLRHRDFKNEVPRRDREMKETVGPELHRSEPPKPKILESRTKLLRNDPCSCGSGKKYKHCCLGRK